MTVRRVSITLVTTQVDACREFHTRHFGAHTQFDCGWYVVLRYGTGADAAALAFMAPREGIPPTAGALVNLYVDDVDALHARCVAAGLPILAPLEDHDWGDRSFGVLDPSGAVVTLLVPIPPRGEVVTAYLTPHDPAPTATATARRGA